MMKYILCLPWILLTGVAHAQTCPDYYRFVDFGHIAQDGLTYRGGTLLRVENFDGAPILIRSKTRCQTVRDIAADGHGNPIPVIERVSLKPEKLGLKVLKLHLTTVPDTKTKTEDSAQTHRKRLANPKNIISRGKTYLCVHDAEQSWLSCQIASPNKDNLALILYCDGSSCQMPVLALDKTVYASAKWDHIEIENASIDSIASQIIGLVQKIYDSLDPLISRK